MAASWCASDRDVSPGCVAAKPGAPHGEAGTTSAQLNVIKCVGSSGRAENISDHPFDYWTEFEGSLWIANPPGYGRSTGRASLASQLPTAQAVYGWVREHTAADRCLITGNSLGGTVAICLAAREECVGLIVRDLPDIRALIRYRYGKFGRAAMAFAQRVPESLDVQTAARQCHVPAIFISSRSDRMVPPKCQDEVINAYAGPKRVVPVAGADHMDPLNRTAEKEYLRALQWLGDILAAG